MATDIFYMFHFYVKVEHLHNIDTDLLMGLETINNSSWQNQR
jgi:hypothetical protein